MVNLIFGKRTRETQWRKHILLNTRFWNSWISTCDKMTSGHYVLPPHIEMDTQQVTDSNVKLPEETQAKRLVI